MLQRDSVVLLWAVIPWAPKNLKAILEVNGIVCEDDWLEHEHVERLLEIYKKEAWEPASMDAVWSAYRSLRQYLHSVHQNEDPELVLPGGDMDSDSEDEDDGKGL